MFYFRGVVDEPGLASWLTAPLAPLKQSQPFRLLSGLHALNRHKPDTLLRPSRTDRCRDALP
jgi:hypothetical protein